MRKGLIMLAVSMLLSLASVAQNAETLDVSKEKDGFYSQTFGEIRVEGVVKDGVKEGTWCEYYANKNLLHRVLQFHKGEMNGLYLEIDESGNLQKKVEYAKGKQHGSSYSWASGGRLTKKNTYKDGQLDGEQVLCYENGNNQEVSNYKDGLRDGVTTWFDQTGGKRMMITYKKDLFEGLQETYYASGKLKSSKMFKNNLQDGPCVEYYESGDVKSESNYKKGSLQGKVKNYEDKHPELAGKVLKKPEKTEKELKKLTNDVKTKQDNQKLPLSKTKSLDDNKLKSLKKE